MQISERTLYLLASLGDLDAMHTLATVDVPGDGVSSESGEIVPGVFSEE